MPKPIRSEREFEQLRGTTRSRIKSEHEYGIWTYALAHVPQNTQNKTKQKQDTPGGFDEADPEPPPPPALGDTEPDLGLPAVLGDPGAALLLLLLLLVLGDPGGPAPVAPPAATAAPAAAADEADEADDDEAVFGNFVAFEEEGFLGAAEAAAAAVEAAAAEDMEAATAPPPAPAPTATAAPAPPVAHPVGLLLAGAADLGAPAEVALPPPNTAEDAAASFFDAGVPFAIAEADAAAAFDAALLAALLAAIADALTIRRGGRIGTYSRTRTCARASKVQQLVEEQMWTRSWQQEIQNAQLSFSFETQPDEQRPSS